MNESSLNCPKCGQIDSVRKVSAIYSEGISAGTYSGPTTSISTPAGDGGSAISSGYSTLRGSSQTLISERLQPPNKPSHSGMSWGAGILVVILLGLGGCSLFGAFVGNPSGAGGPTSAYIFTLVLLVTGTALLIWSLDKSKKQAAQVKSQIPAWETATRRWHRLYYCSRDDIVFDPNNQVAMSPEQINTYIYQA